LSEWKRSSLAGGPAGAMALGEPEPEKEMANQEFTRHHLSSLCGDMDAESFNALVQDIRDQGQLEPIDVVGDEVLGCRGPD